MIPNARATFSSRATMIWATMTFLECRSAPWARSRGPQRSLAAGPRGLHTQGPGSGSQTRPLHGLPHTIAEGQGVALHPARQVLAAIDPGYRRILRLRVLLCLREPDSCGFLVLAFSVAGSPHRRCGDVDDQDQAPVPRHAGDPRHCEASGPYNKTSALNSAGSRVASTTLSAGHGRCADNGRDDHRPVPPQERRHHVWLAVCAAPPALRLGRKSSRARSLAVLSGSPGRPGL